MALVAVVAVQQRRPAGGGNAGDRYGGRIDLRDRPITPEGSSILGTAVCPIILLRPESTYDKFA